MFIVVSSYGIVVAVGNTAEEREHHIRLDDALLCKPDSNIDTYSIVQVENVPDALVSRSHMYIDGTFTKNPAYRAPENDRITQLEALVDALLIAQLEGV